MHHFASPFSIRLEFSPESPPTPDIKLFFLAGKSPATTSTPLNPVKSGFLSQSLFIKGRGRGRSSFAGWFEACV
jgi:hypothetical protein